MNAPSLHQTAEAIEELSAEFRRAFADSLQAGTLAPGSRKAMMDSSRQALFLLRGLAIEIRNLQDRTKDYPEGKQYPKNEPVPDGRLRKGKELTPEDFDEFVIEYRRDHAHTSVGFSPLMIRAATNKIVHFQQSAFCAGEEHHHLLLGNFEPGEKWIAVVPLLRLLDLVRSLPDVQADPSGDLARAWEQAANVYGQR